MPSLKLLLAAASLLTSVRADYNIDPSSVDLVTRQYWCASEISTCPLICSQTAPYTTATDDNTCDATTLTYGCVCSDGLQPNISEYSLTLPYFVCSEWGNQCVTACAGDNTCSSACREDHPCGALSPSPGNATTTASTATATGDSASSTVDSATIIHSAFGSTGTAKTTAKTTTDATATSTSTGSSSTSFAVPLLDGGRVMGVMVTLAGLTAGMALLL